MRSPASKPLAVTVTDIQERWDLYDCWRNPLGHTALRGTRLSAGQYHLVVDICIFNLRGELLIQQRSPAKPTWPGFWDFSAAGSVNAGETSRQAASRELFEELGISHDFAAEVPVFQFLGRQYIGDFYLLHGEPDLGSLVLQQEEVQAVRWVTLAQLRELRETRAFLPYKDGLAELLFSLAVNRENLHADP